jgi:cysteine desulfurase family protein (TIGR01976 family)
VPEPVIKAVADYYRKNNSNLGGSFVTSQNTAELVQRARVQLAEFLNAPAPEEVIFGPNMTTLAFSLSRALARTWQPGDEVIVTSLDHDANITPWRVAAGERGAVVRTWELDLETCTLELADLRRLLTPRTRLVAVTLASNVTGSVIDVASVCQLAHASGAQVFVDAVHFAPHGPIDVQGLGCDFLACSAYKFFGPHLGVLWGRRELLERVESYRVRPAPSCAPGKWETGTQNFEAIAGVQATLAYLREVGYRTSGRAILHDAMNVIREHERHLSRAFLEGIRSQHRVEIYGPADPERCETRTPTFAFRVHGVTPPEVAEKLAHAGIFVWSGHFYAVDLVGRLGLAKDGGLVRAGFVHYNTLEEVERMLDALARI